MTRTVTKLYLALCMALVSLATGGCSDESSVVPSNEELAEKLFDANKHNAPILIKKDVDRYESCSNTSSRDDLLQIFYYPDVTVSRVSSSLSNFSYDGIVAVAGGDGDDIGLVERALFSAPWVGETTFSCNGVVLRSPLFLTTVLSARGLSIDEAFDRAEANVLANGLEPFTEEDILSRAGAGTIGENGEDIPE